MNKEGLAADLVCLLEERSLPRNKAKLEDMIERFFIAGSARIDLIAKVIDLDNEIGGLKFDISNLENTVNNLNVLGNIGGKNMKLHFFNMIYIYLLFNILMVYCPYMTS